MIALVFSYDVGEPASLRAGIRPRGRLGASSSRAAPATSAPSFSGIVEIPHRYLVVDRWESREAYNEFVSANREEYMRRVDESAFHYEHELRLGTFESVW